MRVWRINLSAKAEVMPVAMLLSFPSAVLSSGLMNKTVTMGLVRPWERLSGTTRILLR